MQASGQGLPAEPISHQPPDATADATAAASRDPASYLRLPRAERGYESDSRKWCERGAPLPTVDRPDAHDARDFVGQMLQPSAGQDRAHVVPRGDEGARAGLLQDTVPTFVKHPERRSYTRLQAVAPAPKHPGCRCRRQRRFHPRARQLEQDARDCIRAVPCQRACTSLVRRCTAAPHR